MIALVNALLAPAGNGANAGAAEADVTEAGDAFGRAVGDVKPKKNGPQRSEGSGRDALAKAAAARAGHGAKGAAGTADDDAADATDDVDGEGASPTSPASLLEKLLGAAFAGAALPDAARAVTGDAPEPEGDGELRERIVISTVADLADAAAPDAAPPSVALRVTRMETHFEPRADAARLVDAAETAAPPAAALATAAAEPDAIDTAASADGEGAASGPRPAFGEVLQRLGRTSGGTREGEAGDGGSRSGESRASGASRGRGVAAGASETFDVGGTAPRRAAELASGAASNSTGRIIAEQVAARIADAFAPTADTGGTAATGTASGPSSQLLRLTAGGAALKTLSIQLEPQNLGRLDVSMRLVDGRLTVELAASEPSTARAIAEDRHGLRKILEHAGFALDDAAITIVARDAAPAAATASDASTGGDGGRSGNGAGNGAGFGGGRERGDETPANARRWQPARRAEADEGGGGPARSASLPGGSVYL